MNKPLCCIFLAALFLFCGACEKDFEAINENPFFPTQTELGPLFNATVEKLQLGWDEQLYLHNEVLYGITQQAAKTAPAFQNLTIGTEDMWRNYYSTLTLIREMELRFENYEGDPDALDNVRAMVKIMLAYKTFRLTDLFGDIPFFDAGKGFQGVENLEPKFDAQEEIYKFLLAELKWAEDHINTLPDPTTASGEAYLTFGAFDNLFGSDMMRWRKFANSLRLRHAMRMVEKDPGFATPILSEIIENDLPLIRDGEDVVLVPVDLNWLKESAHWSFREHRKLRMGSNVWHQLSETDSTDGSGIFDPRARIWFETNNAGEWVAFPQVPEAGTPPAGGFPYQGSRDVAYHLKGAANIYSPFNYYLIRDDKQVPEIIMTAAEVRFIKAEMHLRGLGVPMDEGEAHSEYTQGVVSSLKFWQNIVQNTERWENKPPTLSEGEMFAVTNHPRVSIFTSTNKLELIYAQRWLDAFRQPWEAYALLRRTMATPQEAAVPEHYRFPYPPSEATNNPNQWQAQVAKMGEDSERVKVWWIP